MLFVMLEIGDTSGEGHNATRNILVEITGEISHDQVPYHYQKAAEAFGFDVTETCTEDGDSLFPSSNYELIKEFISDPIKEVVDEESGMMYLHQESFVDVYIGIFNSLDPRIQMVKKAVPVIDIGGYGLFE